MTLKDVKFKSSYTSLEDDVARDFYIPVMENAVRFDRMSCYFSPRAMSQYSIGLYYLGKKNSGKYRLLISEEVSEETFNIINNGYRASLLVDENLRARMIENLTIEDHNNLSNLAFLMECKIVEIKFAFCRTGGLFHIKSGYIEDDRGNSMCFKGSNNETVESINRNYESFDITSSWLSSAHDVIRITEEKSRFDQMWSGGTKQIIVVDPSDYFIKYISSFNKGVLINPQELKSVDSFTLDYIESPVLKVPKSCIRISNLKFRLNIQSIVESTDDTNVYFKKSVTSKEARRIYQSLKSYCAQNDYNYEITTTFEKYMQTCNTLESLAALGMSIKHREHIHDPPFHIFKTIVNSLCVRPLTDDQMWDSYLLYNLRRGANFSVPGSGKTATVLGVFAFLYESKLVKRIIMIGPLSSFDTWEYEFNAVFGNKIPLISMNSATIRTENKPLDYNISFNTGNSNLILINYESFDHGESLIDAVSSRIGNDSLLVFDEVHRIKSVTGKRASKLVPLGMASHYTVVMTGTPIPNNYSDVYNFLHVLYPNEYEEYFRYTPTELSNLTDSDMSAMASLMQPFFCRTTKKKLGVPDANTDDILCVSATDEENRLLDIVRKSVTSPLAAIIRILQLESDPSLLRGHISNLELSSFVDDDAFVEIGELNIDSNCLTSKTSACIDLVSKLASEGKKVVIWCIFIKSIENIESMLKCRGLSTCTVYGEIQNRSELLDSFKNGNTQVLITNPQTLAESVSLHMACHDAVYFEYSYNLVHLLQSKDRIHRLGLEHNQYTQYHFMQTEFIMNGIPMSLDKEILSRLNKKEETMLNAIENESMEHFSTTKDEIEEMINDLGIMKVKSNEKNNQTY